MLAAGDRTRKRPLRRREHERTDAVSTTGQTLFPVVTGGMKSAAGRVACFGLGRWTRWLAVSFLAVGATFIGSTVLVQHQAR